jgi:hypothetical protein
MKRLLVLLLALAVPVTVSAQVIDTKPINTVSGGTCVENTAAPTCASFVLGNNNTPSFTVQVGGTFTGTLTIETTSDGVTWVETQLYGLVDDAATTTITATGQYYRSNVGILRVRLRATAWTSGTAIVTVTRGAAMGANPPGGGGGGVGDIEGVTAGAGMTGGGTTGTVTLNVIAGAGITVNANDVQIATAGVTLAMLADLAQDQFIGRITASTGVPETATITAVARTVLDDVTVAAMVDTLFGSAATGAGGAVRETAPNIDSPVVNLLSLTGTVSFEDNIRVTFNPGATVAGLNIGSLAGDPSTPTNGDIWYDSTANEMTARINGANVALGAGGAGAPTDATYITKTANGSLSAEFALGSLSTGCLGVTTTSGDLAARTVTGTASKIEVSNGNCSGNPTITIPASFDISSHTVALPAGTTFGGNALPSFTPAGGSVIELLYFDNADDLIKAAIIGSGLSFSGGTLSASAAAAPFTDTTSLVEGSGDNTKEVRIEVDGLTTANIRVWTAPDSNTSIPIIPQIITVTGPTAARTWTVPDAAFSLARIDAAQTFVGAQTIPTIELNNTDTTLARSAAGQMTIEGVLALTSSNTATLTEKTIDAEASGNTITIPIISIFTPAATQNGTSSLGFNTNTSGAATATFTGTTVVQPIVRFADSGTQEVQLTVPLPPDIDLTKAVEFLLRWKANATSGNVLWKVQGICAGNSAQIPTAYSTSPSSVTDAAENAVQDLNDATLTVEATADKPLVTCSANQQWYVRLYHEPADGSDTINVDADLIALSWRYRTIK